MDIPFFRKIRDYFIAPSFDAETSEFATTLINRTPEKDRVAVAEFLNRLEDTVAVSPQNRIGIVLDPVTDRYWCRWTKEQGHGMWDEFEAMDNSAARKILDNPEIVENFVDKGHIYL